jgi:hypothetical protein
MKRFPSSLIVASAAFVSACSAKDVKTDTTTPGQAGAPTSAPASKASFDPATHVAVIHAKDFAFDAPDSVTAGWTTFHLVNDGTTLHHAALARLDSGKTVADLEAGMKAAPTAPPPAWFVEVGGPNAPDPGGSSDATFNLPAGNYVVLCFVDTPDRVPHFAKGMIRPLKVVASTTPAAPEPTADATVSLSDYAFTVTGKLTPGKHTIKVVNGGSQHHEVEVARIAAGKTSKDLLAWIGKPEGPPPGNALGGIAGAVPGTTSYITLDLTPGDYAFICFLPDAKDAKPHFEHGMVKDFKVQ